MSSDHLQVLTSTCPCKKGQASLQPLHFWATSSSLPAPDHFSIPHPPGAALYGWAKLHSAESP